MKKLWLLMATMLLIAMPLLAHGDKKHVVGTVEKITADAVTVRTADGKSVEVRLAATTVYINNKDGKTGALKDLAAGQRIVIHATPQGKNLIADEVKFSAAKPAPRH